MVRSTIENMRMLCYNSDFGRSLFDALSPVDLKSFMLAFMIELTDVQMSKYMLVWRQLFTDRSFLRYMESRKFKVMIAGANMLSVSKALMTKGTYVRPAFPLHMSMFLLRTVDMPTLVNMDSTILPSMTAKEQNHEVYKELMFNDQFKSSMRYGVEFRFMHNRPANHDFALPRLYNPTTLVSVTSMVTTTNWLSDRYMRDGELATRRMVSVDPIRLGEGEMLLSRSMFMSGNWALRQVDCIDASNSEHVSMSTWANSDESAPTIRVMDRRAYPNEDMYEHTDWLMGRCTHRPRG